MGTSAVDLVVEETLGGSGEEVRCAAPLPGSPGMTWHEVGVEVTLPIEGVRDGGCALFWDGALLAEATVSFGAGSPDPTIGAVRYVLGTRTSGNVTGNWLRMDDLCIAATAAEAEACVAGVVPMDAGVDASTMDASVDAATDAGRDAGADAGEDARPTADARTDSAHVSFRGAGGCACRAAAAPTAPTSWLLPGLVLSVLLLRRR
jgi:MYXO-CTERM domain-containing protein